VLKLKSIKYSCFVDFLCVGWKPFHIKQTYDVYTAENMMLGEELTR
jgi:hypothetical protein